MSAMNTTPTLGDLPTEEELDFALDIKRRAKSGERVPESDLDRALGIKRRAKAYRAAGAKPVEPSAVLPDNLSPNPDFYTQHMQNVNRGPLDVASAAPAIPAPPPGWRQGVDALNFGDIPILGPAQRLVQAATETEGERLARQYATPQLSGVAGFGTKVARMAGGVMDPGGAAVGTSANILEQGGSPIEAAFGGGVAALSNFARVPGAEKLGQFATGALSRSAPDVVRRGVGLAAQGAAAGIGLGEAQALAEGVAAVPRGIGQQAEAGNPDPIRAAITDEVNRLVAAQPDILASGALGGVVAEGVMRGLGRAFQGRQSRQARPAEGAMPGAGRPEALGETSLRSPRPQPTDGQSLPLESNALPQTPTGEVRSRDAQTGSSETAPRELLSWASSEVPGTAAFPRTPEVPAETSPRAGMAADRTSNNASASQAESRPLPDPIRSGDTLAEGSTVADAKGNTFTVGATLGNGKTVVRAENGKTLRLTAGEMEARGWRRESVSQTLIGDKSQNPSDGRPDSPHTSIPDTKSQDLNQAGSKKQLQSRVDGDLVRASPDRTPPQDVSPNATNRVAEAVPESGRVGPPPEEVANPPVKPKGESNPSEIPNSSPPEPGTPGFLDGMIQNAQARKSERSRALREARKNAKPGERLGASILPDIVDDVIIAAAKAVKAGGRTAKAMRDVVKEHLGREDADVTRRAWRLVRESQGADGTHDDARFEVNASDLMEEATSRVASTKSVIREQTGQTANETDTITQREALLGQLEAEERGANRAAKDAEVVRKAQEKRDARRMQAAVGLERGAAEQSAQIQAGLAEQRTERKLSAQAEKFKAERQAMREKFADALDTERAKAAVGQDIRARLVQVARENLDHADVRKVMAFIAKARAKNPVTKTRPDGTTITDPVTRDFYAGLKRILDVADRSAARQSIKSLKGTTGTERTENPQTIGAALFNALHKNTPESKFRKNRIDDTEVSKLRPEYRDALAPVVDAVRNGYADKTDALADFIQKQVDEGRSNAMTPEDLSVLKGTKGKLIDEMSTRERTVLENAIRHTAYLSDKANEVQVLGERHDLLKLRDRAAQEITDFTKNAEAWNPSESERLGEKAGAVVQWVKDFLTSTQDSLSTLAGKLGGMGSALHDTVYRSVARAESKAITTEREAIKASGLEGVTPARIARLNRKQTIRIGGKDFRFSPAEMIDLIGSWNDPSTRAEIEKAGVVLESDAARADRTFFVGDDFIRMVESALRPEDRALLNSMQKAMNDTYQLANDAHERMHGYRLPDTDNHWSRVRAREQTERGDSSEMEARLRGSRAFEDSGIFKDRSTTNAPVVVRNPLEWVPDQIHTLAGMAHLAEPMRAARRLIDGPAVKAAIEKAGGKGMARTMNQRLAELVQSPYADPEGINGFLSKLVNFSARQKLAFRITTVAKQRLGLLQAATAARDAGLAAKLTGKILDPSTWSPAKRNRLRAEIEPRSGYLAQRSDPAFAATIASAANPKLKVAASKIGRAIQGVERVGLSGLQFADADVVLGTYDTVKNHLAESKGLTGDALVDAAVTKTEEIIRESQNPTSMLDMSGAQLAGRRNALWGAYTLFSSSSNKLRNLLRQSYFEYQADKTPQNLRKLATATALAGTNAVLSRSIGLLLGGVMVRSIVSSIGGDTADEKKPKTASDFAVGAFAELADSVLPGGGNALRVFKGGSAGGQSWLESVVAQGASVAKAFENPTKRPLDKAAAVLRAARVLGVAPDAVLDYTTAIVEGIAGPEPAGWSVKAALDRGDQKAAIRRGSEYITLRAKKDPEKDRDENLLDAKETLRASILAAMNKDVAKDDVDTRATNGELADRIAEEAYSLAR